MVCRVLAEHGLLWKDGSQDPVQLGRVEGAASYKTYEHPGWKKCMKSLTGDGHWPLGEMLEATPQRINKLLAYYISQPQVDFVKVGVEFADCWRAFADHTGKTVNFIKVYRPPEDIAESLERRNIGSYDLGYSVAVKRLNLMENLPGEFVATNLLVGDEEDRAVSGIYQALRDCQVGIDYATVNQAIEPNKFHG
jgi:hypothetical protein